LYRRYFTAFDYEEVWLGHPGATRRKGSVVVGRTLKMDV
jgi:hypothetical protein